MSARIIYRGLIALAVFLPLRLFTVADPFLTVLLSFQLCQLVFQICDGLFSMAYLLLNFALLLFNFSFGFQIAVIRDLSDPLLDCSRDFVEAALDLVFRAGFHISPFLVGSSQSEDFGFGAVTRVFKSRQLRSAQFGSGSVQTDYPQFDEVAFCSLICTSFTTCFTLGFRPQS